MVSCLLPRRGKPIQEKVYSEKREFDFGGANSELQVIRGIEDISKIISYFSTKTYVVTPH